jgi:hypothetical protein
MRTFSVLRLQGLKGWARTPCGAAELASKSNQRISMVVIFLVLLDLLHMPTIRLLSPARTRLTSAGHPVNRTSTPRLNAT